MHKARGAFTYYVIRQIGVRGAFKMKMGYKIDI